jgi:cell division protein FtsN
MVRKVDLGTKGIYYRTMVGPFATSDEASKLCSSLKAAGGSCFVQRI